VQAINQALIVSIIQIYIYIEILLFPFALQEIY